MRFLFWLIAIFALAAGVAILAGGNDSYMLVVVPKGWWAQISLNLFIVLCLLAFLCTHVLLCLFSKTLKFPERLSSFRQRRQQQRVFSALKDAIQALFEGRFEASLKQAKKAYVIGDSEPLAALLAARAAYRKGNRKSYHEWLAKLNQNRDWRVASLLTEAELALGDGLVEEAASALLRLQQTDHRGPAALRMALTVATAQQRWQEVIDLVARLSENKAISADELSKLLSQAYRQRLLALIDDAPAQELCWKTLPKPLLSDAAFLGAAVRALGQGTQAGLARKAVERVLDSDWNTELAGLYYRTLVTEKDAQGGLLRAEKWLKEHPQDPGLLYSLGEVCVLAQLPGKAQQYFEASLAVQDAPEVHCALARLFETLEQPEEALNHYRIALAPNNAAEKRGTQE